MAIIFVLLVSILIYHGIASIIASILVTIDTFRTNDEEDLDIFGVAVETIMGWPITMIMSAVNHLKGN